MLSNDVLRLRLTRARERLGLSPREMANRLKTPRRIYEQWEGGQRRIPGPALVAAELAAGIIRKDFPQPGSLAARVLELADGSMTTTEAAQALGITPSMVRSAMNALQARGYTISFARGWKPRTPQRNAAIVAGVAAGRTYAELAREYGVSRQRIQQISKAENVKSVRGRGRVKRSREDGAEAEAQRKTR